MLCCLSERESKSSRSAMNQRVAGIDATPPNGMSILMVLTLGMHLYKLTFEP